MPTQERARLEGQAERLQTEIYRSVESGDDERAKTLQRQLETIEKKLSDSHTVKRRLDLPQDPDIWICVKQCYRFNRLWEPGEAFKGDDPGKHFKRNSELPE